MWTVLIWIYTSILTITLPIVHVATKEKETLFTKGQVIFSSGLNITSILVPTDVNYMKSNDIPSIFFTVTDKEGGTCIYILEGLAAHEILEGGTDSTSDHGRDNAVYFGSRDGLYKYKQDTLSAKRFGAFRDHIIQLQKAIGSDAIYVLTIDNKLYKLEKRATVKTRIEGIVCALEFVLDTSNNIYYVDCKDKMIHIIESNGRIPRLEANVLDEFKYMKLMRPAFVMESSIPFFGDGFLYILYSNGTNEKKELYIKEKPSAFSVDATLYLVAALNGKIYEFNVMEVLLNNMFGVMEEWPRNVTKIILSLMESAREGFMDRYNDLKALQL